MLQTTDDVGKGGAPAPVPARPHGPCCPIPGGRNINLVAFPASAARPLSFFPQPAPSNTLAQLASRSISFAITHDSTDASETHNDKDHSHSFDSIAEISR
ncbi:hypothetical protein FJTKL_04358 [Diaporthe vaccinii]|uniref:Uncharacterized protein n=1 Tax=Diaporthe vaccinii TaxID=105482 RepID=A0ABR4F0U2_9PEZI